MIPRQSGQVEAGSVQRHGGFGLGKAESARTICDSRSTSCSELSMASVLLNVLGGETAPLRLAAMAGNRVRSSSRRPWKMSNWLNEPFQAFICD